MRPCLDVKFKDTSFRLAEVADAEFILGLRTDGQLNTYLSPTSNDLDAQREWLSRYKKLEAENSEFYFIVEYEAKPVGTARIYNIRGDSFGWGSWIIKRGTPRCVSVASTLLIYQVGFEILGYEKGHFEIRKENDSVRKFQMRMGAEIVGEDDLQHHFSLTKAAYRKNRERMSRFA